jgi:flagella basal body P-ring formation protein FlgA
MKRIALIALAAALPVAMLRSHVLLRGPDVRLSDLFDDAGPKADRRLGPSPAPGGRIVVEAAQLGAIARQFGVDWRPESSGDRAVLERPGRALDREGVLAAVRGALQTAGAAADCEITLPGFASPMVPAGPTLRLDVTQLDYDRGSGRFTAILSVTGTGMDPINLRIAGEADDTVALPVASARLPVGTVLAAEDVRMARVRVSTLHGDVAHAMADVVGMQLRHPSIPGQPLARGDLTRPASVQRGAAVRVGLDAAGLTLSAQGIAMESGATGERIRVMNATTRAVLEAEVVGPGQVRVLPNTLPLPGAAGGYQAMR